MSFEAAVHAKAIQLNHLCLDMCATAGSGHPTSAMSLGHIVTVLMYNSMRWVPNHGRYPTSDRLVLSEGHAVPIIYAIFADIGAAVGYGDQRQELTIDDLSSLRATDSVLDGHPNPMEGFPFFDAATGSLGQGLSVAAGLGKAARLDGLDKRIFCLCGDGEAREGQIAEAMDFIADHQLGNVLPIFNCNEYGQADRVSPQQSPETLARKLEAYGFMTLTIDGHDPTAIKEAFDTFVERSGRQRARRRSSPAPSRAGARRRSRAAGWHGKPPAGEKLEQAHAELKSASVSLTSALAGDDLAIYPPEEEQPVEKVVSQTMAFEEAMKAYDMEMLFRSGKLATRKAYGLALRALGHAHPDVVALDADVQNSTFAEWFANDSALSDRFVSCKIAEQNMVSAAAGLAAAGKIPFCSSFAKFVTRAYDQIEMAINSGANIKIVGSHSGVSLAADGPSQMALPDIAWFRSFATITDHHGGPGCYVLQPADAYAAYALTLAMAEHYGACYMRTHRPDVEFLYSDETTFRLGGMEVLTKGRDLLIVTAGYMVHECNKALEDLDNLGIDASIIDLYSLPFEADQLLDHANDNGGNILVVEDNYGASLGSAVADACMESGDGFMIEQLHVRRIPKSARDEAGILQQCGLDHAAIAKRAASMLGVVTA